MKKRLLAILLLIPILISAGCGAKTPAGPPENGLYKSLIIDEELEGFGDPEKLELYTNNELVADGVFNEVRDNKKFYYSGDVKRMVNYAEGYRLDIPADLEPDFSLSGIVVKLSAPDLVITVSTEDGDCQKNIAHDQRFIRDEKYIRENRIINVLQEIRDVGEYKVDVLHMELDEMPEDGLGVFTHLNFYNPARTGYTSVLVKHTAARQFDVDAFINSYKSFFSQGGCVRTVEYPLTVPEYWTQETKDYFEYLCTSDHVDWGIFCGALENRGLTKTVPNMEEKIGEKFAIISRYWHFSAPPSLPENWLAAIDERGYVLQLTYQFTVSNNLGLNGYNPNLDIYRGEGDERLRKLARSVRDFGRPVLLRLNNEMNTDWTTYSGCATMCDPDIFVSNWQRMYDIFIEEGAYNTIWISNGQDNSWPGRNWNHSLRFFPGVDYTHIIGLTAYNGGRDNWHTFEAMYTPLQNRMNEYFSEWPWVIGEFGCNSISFTGESKEQWISDMFDSLHLYPNIKAAIWFSANDHDLETDEVINQYTLDDDDAYLYAFGEGIRRSAQAIADSRK